MGAGGCRKRGPAAAQRAAPRSSSSSAQPPADNARKTPWLWLGWLAILMQIGVHLAAQRLPRSIINTAKHCAAATLDAPAPHGRARPPRRQRAAPPAEPCQVERRARRHTSHSCRPTGAGPAGPSPFRVWAGLRPLAVSHAHRRPPSDAAPPSCTGAHPKDLHVGLVLSLISVRRSTPSRLAASGRGKGAESFVFLEGTTPLIWQQRHAGTVPDKRFSWVTLLPLLVAKLSGSQDVVLILHGGFPVFRTH